MMVRKRFASLFLDRVGKPTPGPEKVRERKGRKIMLSELGVCNMEERHEDIAIVFKHWTGCHVEQLNFQISLECGIRVSEWSLPAKGEILLQHKETFT